MCAYFPRRNKDYALLQTLSQNLFYNTCDVFNYYQ